MGLCFFLSISSVLAGDANDTGNFTELNTIINDSNDDISLADDYKHVDGDDDVVISKSIKINGNNHTIDSDDSPIIIDANDTSVIFEDVNFIDYKFEISENNTSNLTFINCCFKSTFNDSNAELNLTQFDANHTSGEISPTIKLLAQSIVGDLTGYEAAYELATWVGTNIRHETAAGFYQTADETLNRRRGNCCSQTDLFLQMCVAVGVNEKHKLYYVQVGTYEFGARHFFAMIDNVLIDVDARPDSPWGQASIANREFYRIIEYPYLPIAREY